mmetsp:Transcript_1607/g.3861  ORF Transcript_1607/g.3861 Transcript_1607/m.3861 type:complete len:222 (-) Transcript_1607:140-805(-)
MHEWSVMFHFLMVQSKEPLYRKSSLRHRLHTPCSCPGMSGSCFWLLVRFCCTSLRSLSSIPRVAMRTPPSRLHFLIVLSLEAVKRYVSPMTKQLTTSLWALKLRLWTYPLEVTIAFFPFLTRVAILPNTAPPGPKPLAQGNRPTGWPLRPGLGRGREPARWRSTSAPALGPRLGRRRGGSRGGMGRVQASAPPKGCLESPIGPVRLQEAPLLPRPPPRNQP